MGTFCIDQIFSFTDSIVRLIQKDDVQIETFCCIFKRIRIDWSSINVTGLSGTMITMPDIALFLYLRIMI